MATTFPPLMILFLISSLSLLTINATSSPSHHQNPDSIVDEVNDSINNSSRRNLGYLSCGTGNPIDDCWRCDSNWASNRQRLADCAIGFGKNAIGGRNGQIYVVTDPGNDNPVNPVPGTLRHAVIQDVPLWIIFKRDMVIQLRQELVMNSFKTIDGRGVNVHIGNGPCITIHYATNIIIHGIHIHDCKQAGNGNIRNSPHHSGWWTQSDGDGISIFASQHVWVDHCSLCRHGYFHVVNNDYTHWEMYAIGGKSEWKNWNWRSEGDLMLNGAYFRESGRGSASTYARASSLSGRPSTLVAGMTRAAGALICRKGSHC
ncbi:hypothetical protein Ccrd_012421 [Cynara cardunculus var. scolymus]|uniref:Pectate lyase n=1 Tax=Cynara cardunculus var. scolymus TaxID=59895 RepID=A0A103YHK6_CYNCS|nr:hypothetical protein Ccrd_012421 [Cynara cardunculus var. scolymus]